MSGKPSEWFEVLDKELHLKSIVFVSILRQISAKTT